MLTKYKIKFQQNPNLEDISTRSSTYIIDIDTTLKDRASHDSALSSDAEAVVHREYRVPVHVAGGQVAPGRDLPYQRVYANAARGIGLQGSGSITRSARGSQGQQQGQLLISSSRHYLTLDY